MKALLTAILALMLMGCTHPESSNPSPERSTVETQERGPREQHLGKTKQELQAVFGAAVSEQVQNDQWEIWDSLGPGAHSFVWVTQITFRDNVAVQVKRYEKAVGCILVEPAERWPAMDHLIQPE